MTDVELRNPHSHLQNRLARVAELLRRQHLVEELAHQDGVVDLRHRQHVAELQAEIGGLHPADIAYILEALPTRDRLAIWNLVKADRDGAILLEVSDSVRESLLAEMDRPELLAAAGQLDADDLATLAEELPEDVLDELMRRLNARPRPAMGSSVLITTLTDSGGFFIFLGLATLFLI